MFKNKVLILFIIFIFLFGFLCTSVYATEETAEPFTFTGFDGIYYTLPSLPEGISNYNYYVLLKKDSFPKFTIYCFNETLEITRSDSFLYLNGDSDTTGKLFTLNDIDSTSWVEMGEQGKFSYPISTIFIYSCQDLLVYEEYFDDENFTFPLQTEGTLAPIYQKTRLVGVLQEILAILPVILMTIVGLIGLRKALKFLSMVLHRS